MHMPLKSQHMQTIYRISHFLAITQLALSYSLLPRLDRNFHQSFCRCIFQSMEEDLLSVFYLLLNVFLNFLMDLILDFKCEPFVKVHQLLFDSQVNIFQILSRLSIDWNNLRPPSSGDYWNVNLQCYWMLRQELYNLQLIRNVW